MARMAALANRSSLQININQLLLSLLVFHVIGSALTTNILFVIPFTSKSHYVNLSPIAVELAKRGYNVTTISAHRIKNPPPNYTEIITSSKSIWENKGDRGNVFQSGEQSFTDFQKDILWDGGIFITEEALASQSMKDFMANKDNKFDLVINELFFQEALYMFAHKYSAPHILVTTYGNCLRTNFVMRNPLQLAYVLQEFVKIERPDSFWGRLENVYVTADELVGWYFWYMPRQEELVQKYFKDLPPNPPSLLELQRKPAVVLVNSHFSMDVPTAYFPNIIEIGGPHAKDGSPLPKDLQKILDEAINGVVYMNFGTNLRSTELSDAKLSAVLNVFRRLKYAVVWKWEDTNMVNKPDNVFLLQWVPQNDVLAHPNIKVFISHGGLLGTQEAVFHGVPIIGIPIYADQLNNVLDTQNRGFGILLKYKDITEESFGSAIDRVLNDASYMKNAKDVSRRFRDRPMNGLDTAVYWIEYVIRHKGAKFMTSPATDMSWFAYYMVDISLFLIAIFGVVTYVFMRVIPRLISALLPGTKNN